MPSYLRIGNKTIVDHEMKLMEGGGPKLKVTPVEVTSSGTCVTFGDLPKGAAEIEVTFSGISLTCPDASDTLT